jgi:HAD superfamily hydrolase (TIGR01509 family)
VEGSPDDVQIGLLVTAILFGSISTLADTSELQREAFNAAFAEHGLDWRWDRDDYAARLDSNGGADRIAAYAAERGEEVDAAAVHATKSRKFQEMLASADVQARPGVAETIAAAKDAGHKVALVTTTSRENLDALGAALEGQVSLADLDLVVDKSQVDRPKPDGEVYRYAVAQLGEQADGCVAVEDNVGGVQSARAAGVAVVAFPNANTARHDFSSAAATRDTVALDDLLGLTA